ncbi:phosphoribosylamine--glycine ligase [Rickettsiales bacterium]|nr:phosphoribosylamine--glycine ligase [Rickettsiales bacterium]
MNKVLVIGNGGREHAIINKIKESALVVKIYAINGNGGIAKIAQCITNVNIQNHDEVIKFCQEKEINLVVIGPEQPLIEGLADSLRDKNINVFGPSKLAARLEGSKIFTKKLCDEFNIPTAKYKNFNNKDEAIAYLEEASMPIVVKADGIAAGKGVIIAQNKMEAVNAVKEILDGKFGKAGNDIVIEEFLEGPEISFFAICDGFNAHFFGHAGDHKKVGEGETGLNTGGMGTYSPSPFINDKMHQKIMDEIINPTLKGMANLGSHFSGILFAGLILTKNGPKLLEFNTRLGDPEAQTILLRLKSDLYQIMLESAQGKITSKIEFDEKKAVCVVMAANGYPNSYKKGTIIENLQEAENQGNITIFHAGTKIENGKILANGGRVLGISSVADNFATARQNSYKAIAKINWKDGFYRKDIAAKVA